MKVGLLQVQRLGDLIIVLPIARWFVDRGHEVYWPVRLDMLLPMIQAEPRVNFLPVSPIGPSVEFVLYHEPMRLLREVGCDPIFCLYSHLGQFVDKRLESLKFDEYKYAVAGVPFSEKWALQIKRDEIRERALHDSLRITREYVLVQDKGSLDTVDVRLPPSWRERYQIVTIDKRTDNPFDWIGTIEKAAKRVMLDSSFANLTDQMNIAGDNYLILRSITLGTPVLRNGWHFCWPFDPIPERPDWASD